MKVCVYAIAKNEAKFVKRWVKSMKEADAIYVLDTGSTDKTVKKLTKYGVYVSKVKIEPWRFDVARNKSLDLVPKDTDICVCTDLDEVFESGWRKKLELRWQEDTTRVYYNYNWRLDENDHALINFNYSKIHKREGYRWVYPVHEVLQYDQTEKIITINDINLNHYPDTTKSRSSYMSLLELSVCEDPDNDRHWHYLGREYMYYARYQEAIDTLITHLSLKSSTWKDERCASMRFIARCYLRLSRFEEAKMWLDKAMNEASYLRDSFVERAYLAYVLNEYQDVVRYANMALNITYKSPSYINEIFSFDHTLYDLLAVAYYYLKNYKAALKNINYALAISPNDSRLLSNKEFILEALIETREK